MLPVFFYKTPLKIRLFTGLTINSVKTLGKPNENTEILQLSHTPDLADVLSLPEADPES